MRARASAPATPRNLHAVAATLVLSWGLAACAPRASEPVARRGDVPGAQRPGDAVVTDARSAVQRGEATYYAAKLRGRKTASGERYDPAAFTCAHRTLPFGTLLEVRRPDTGQSVQVTVNDRGPFGSARRIVDLSFAAAKVLQMTKLGVIDVELRVTAAAP